MDFTRFQQLLTVFSRQELPGEAAHQLLSPPERLRLMADIDFNVLKPRQAAVMLLLYPKRGRTFFVLIRRNAYKGVHSSQVAFPGGKKEETDATFVEAALRETREEIGVAEDEIRVVRELSPLYIPPSNFLAHPVVGISTHQPVFIPDPREVAGIIEVALEEFLDDTILTRVPRETSYAGELELPAYRIGEHIVWGATAMVLSEFRLMLQSALNHKFL